MNTLRTSALIVAALLAAAAVIGCASSGGPAVQTSPTGYQRVMTDQIFSVKYDAQAKVLTVVSRDGQDVSDYQDVPQEIFDKFMASTAKDEFYAKEIKDAFKSKKFKF